MCLNANPGAPHGAGWHVVTVLPAPSWLETGISDMDKLHLELDPWHVSPTAVGMWVSPSRLPPLAERRLPEDFVGIFFNAEFYSVVFRNNEGLWGRAELQGWLPPLVLLGGEPARLHPAPWEGTSDGIGFLHHWCFFQLFLKPS